MEPIHKIELYVSKDDLGKLYVAGKTMSGKSTYLRGLAAKKHFLYLSNEEGPWFVKCKEKIGLIDKPDKTWPFEGSMTCQQFLEAFSDYIGYVIDCTKPWEVFTDWKTYKWPKPVIYSVQLNCGGNLGMENYVHGTIHNFPVGELANAK